MAGHAEVKVARPDVDIENDVMRVFGAYPPLRHDRSRVNVTINEGAVVATGYVKTAQSREVFSREASKVEGVTSVDVSGLYDDEALRLQVGYATPFGVYASVSYGAVVLNGKLPEGTNVDDMVKKVAKMDGVRTVIPNF